MVEFVISLASEEVRDIILCQYGCCLVTIGILSKTEYIVSRIITNCFAHYNDMYIVQIHRKVNKQVPISIRDRHTVLEVNEKDILEQSALTKLMND